MRRDADGERYYMAGLMRARLGAAYAADVYPLVEGLVPQNGPELVAPGHWRATWQLRDGWHDRGRGAVGG